MPILELHSNQLYCFKFLIFVGGTLVKVLLNKRVSVGGFKSLLKVNLQQNQHIRSCKLKN